MIYRSCCLYHILLCHPRDLALARKLVGTCLARAQLFLYGMAEERLGLVGDLSTKRRGTVSIDDSDLF